MGCRSPAVGTWGVGFNRYDADFGGADDTTLTEWSFLRYFFKEDDDSTPVSFVAHAALFLDDYGGEDEGLGTRLPWSAFKKLRMSDGFSCTRSSGFHRRQSSFRLAVGTPSAPSTSHVNLGHGQIACGSNGWLRVTAEEHSFRRETFRAARVAYVRRSIRRVESEAIQSSEVVSCFDLAGHTV